MKTKAIYLKQSSGLPYGQEKSRNQEKSGKTKKNDKSRKNGGFWKKSGNFFL